MTHEVVVAMLIQSGRILLGKRSAARQFFPDVWDMFGGHVEPGEALEETLARELQEELDITPSAWTFVETFRQPLRAQDGEPADELIAHVYLVHAWTGRPVNRQPEEHSQIAWLTLSQAVALPLADPVYPELFGRYLNEE
jgi:mutator protein MutT